MKRYSWLFATFAVALISCNNDSESTTTTDTTSTTTMTGTDTTANTTNNMSSTPLTGEDSTFAVKAAIGGLMEVEAGNLAQQNGSSQRVKDFGAMMVRDHSAASEELKALATSKGFSLPTTMPESDQKHMDMVRNMKGKSFDDHYKSMMLDHHTKDVSEFEKASNNLKDPDLKNWATKTLPTLKMHLDSAKALNNKGK